MNVLKSIRPMAEAKLALIPRFQAQTCHHIQFSLIAIRFVQVLISIYSVYELTQFEVYSLFEINCGPSTPTYSISNNHIVPQTSDRLVSQPNLSYDQLQSEDMVNLRSQHWLFFKKEYRSFGFLTPTGRTPSADSRVYQITNYQKLPFQDFQYILPRTCDSVPKMIEFRNAARKIIQARRKKEEQAALPICPANNNSTDTANNSSSDANPSTSSNETLSDEPAKCRTQLNSTKEGENMNDDDDDLSDALDSTNDALQIVVSSVGDHFQVYARILHVTGVYVFMAIVIYLLFPTAYRNNRMFLMCFDVFFSVFLLLSLAFLTNYFAKGVNNLYDYLSPFWLLNSSQICSDMLMCRVTSYGNWDVLDQIVLLNILSCGLWLMSIYLTIRLNSKAETETDSSTMASIIIANCSNEKEPQKC